MKILFVCLALVLAPYCVWADGGYYSGGTVCPFIWMPVCGKRTVNGKEEYRTFGNSCVLSGTKGYTMVRDGAC